MDMTALRAHAHQILRDATIPELPRHYHGKVRENYDLADGSRILIATDRLSAFDRILAAIPLKGQVLTQTARFWFEATADICPNHVIAYPDPNVVVGRRLEILPVEIVVRDYLAGTTGTSVLTMYRDGVRDMYGITLPDGLRDNQRLPHPIITPTSKAFDGGHDMPLSAAEILDQGLADGSAVAGAVRSCLRAVRPWAGHGAGAWADPGGYEIRVRHGCGGQHCAGR